jgi:hypothetical protein
MNRALQGGTRFNCIGGLYPVGDLDPVGPQENDLPRKSQNQNYYLIVHPGLRHMILTSIAMSKDKSCVRQG